MFGSFLELLVATIGFVSSRSVSWTNSRLRTSLRAHGVIFWVGFLFFACMFEAFLEVFVSFRLLLALWRPEPDSPRKAVHKNGVEASVFHSLMKTQPKEDGRRDCWGWMFVNILWKIEASTQFLCTAFEESPIPAAGGPQKLAKICEKLERCFENAPNK